MASGPYSRNTFEAFAKLRHYVGVRIKQGVPLVDADLNEQDDLRRYELRNFLRWFVGDGVPEANDGFRIAPSGQPNDVFILGGDGTPEGAGRILADGLEALNESDVLYSAQEFANPANAAAAGVGVVTMPTPPAMGTRPDLYYLDVWEREVTSAEATHNDIVDPRIGIETARRLRREWAVRAIDQATGVPADDSPAGHRYYPLASVLRTAGETLIPPGAIVDLRRRGVSLQPRAFIDQIAQDGFGPGYTLDPDGQPNLFLSLREVINAILRDGRPAVVGPRTFQTANGPHNFPASAVDVAGAQWVFWIGQEGGATRVLYQRTSGGGWTPPAVAFTPSGTLWDSTAVTGTPDGSLWFFYSARVGAQWRILGRRFHDGAWEPEFTISSGTNNFGVAAAGDASGNVMVVWRQVNVVRSRLYLAGVEQPIVDAAPAAATAPAKVALPTATTSKSG